MLRNRTLSQNGLYLCHIIVLFSGFFIGTLTAYYFNSIKFDFSGDIQEAKRLGIVSPTVLSGYSKFRDILTYLSVLGFPVVFSVGTWLLWANKERRNLLREMFLIKVESSTTKNIGWKLSAFLVAISYLLFSFNINNFFYILYYENVGVSPFLAEEGVNLTWAYSILSGEAYGKDFACLYGPMSIYPLAWAMKLFGTTLVVARSYTYFLNLTAYSITIFFLYKTLRLRTVFFLSSFIFFIAFSPATLLSPQWSYLRVTLGVLPILLAYLYLENRNRFLLPFIGIILGQSLLFSQEVGLCSLLAVTIFFLSSHFLKKDFKVILWEGILISAGYLLSIAPMLLYLYSKEALGPFFDSFYLYPKVISLGFGALPFPDFHSFIASPLSRNLLIHYWTIFIYVFTSIYLIPLVFLESLNKSHLLKISLLVFGIFLFRYALGRSDVIHVLHSSQPAFLLLFLFLDGALKGIFKDGPAFKKVGNLLLLIVLIISTECLLIVNTGFSSNFIKGRFSPLNFRDKWSIVLSGNKISDLDRGGDIFFDSQTASFIVKIRKFLEANTKAGDYVYFFPNEAAYYFIFDRKSPTRYAISYLAVTTEQRLELIRDLERKKPKYVVYSKNTWRIDDISEEIQVPEVVEYLYKKYKPIVDMGEDALIAERIDM